MAAAESSSSVDSAEALTYTLCLSSENQAYSEGRTEAGSLGEMFLYGYQQDSGRVCSKHFRTLSYDRSSLHSSC